eukprot:SAG25_NODE_539_length_7086_cov_2.350937_4_plen_80_part_00
MRGDDGYSAAHTPATTTTTADYTIYYLNYPESLGSRSSVHLLVGRVIARGVVLCNALCTSNTPHGNKKNMHLDCPKIWP